MEDTTLEFYLFRHGQAEAQMTPERIMGRSPDTRLTPLGALQSHALGKRLRRQGTLFDAVISSPLPRATQTRDIVLPYLKEQPPINEIDHRLVEYSHGKWEGQVRSEIYTLERLHQREEQGLDFCPPNGESPRAVIRRVSWWLEDSILNHPRFAVSGQDFCVGIYGHTTVIRAIVDYAVRMNPSIFWRMQIDNCSITRLRFDRHGWSLLAFNDAHHTYGLERQLKKQT